MRAAFGRLQRRYVLGNRTLLFLFSACVVGCIWLGFELTVARGLFTFLILGFGYVGFATAYSRGSSDLKSHKEMYAQVTKKPLGELNESELATFVGVLRECETFTREKEGR